VQIRALESGYVVIASDGDDYHARGPEKQYAVSTLEEAIELVRENLVLPPFTEGDPITAGDIHRAVYERPPEVEVP